MGTTETGSGTTWIIGYGNVQRRDDGIGPYIITHLESMVDRRSGVRLRALQQLEPELAEELQGAKRIILVDATTNELADGTEWSKVAPEGEALPLITHHCKPSSLLSIIRAVYTASPETWLMSVQGDDFGYAEGLTEEAQKRATRAIREIIEFVARETN